jgi:pimeloyl-ACP methyl ester carboxylesterase
MAIRPSDKNYVLVHGAWRGGWCWRRVAELLERGAHQVFAPTLTGLGERAHLLNPQIDLTTHITDVVNVIRYEDLHNIVLVGHSYAGFVASGVVERVESRIAAFVLLDAFLPNDGDNLARIATPAVHDAIKAALARAEATMPSRSAATFRDNPADQAWIDSLSGARDRIAKRVYIRASGYPNPVFDETAARLRATPGWQVYDFACGHDIMVDMPEQLAELLERIA